MTAADYQPSTRTRIYNLVLANARRTGRRPVKVWDDLYGEFEARTNRPWRKIAHNNGYSPMDAIHALRQMDDFLELARQMLNPSVQTPSAEIQEQKQ